jgi:hypothetical protein
MQYHRVLETLRDRNKHNSSLVKDWQLGDPTEWPGITVDQGELVEL